MRLAAVVLVACAATPSAGVSNEMHPPLVVETVPVVGDPHAKVSITYWFDYECPHCVEFAPVVEGIEKKYGNAIAVYYKDFPISHHRLARPAAIAAEAARRQGKYFEMHRLLIATSPRFEDADLRADATQLGLDLAAYDIAIHDPAAAARITADYKAGEDAGVMGVPAFAIDGKLYDGDLSAEALGAQIDAALK